MNNQILLQQVLESLKRQNKMPRRIDFSKVGDRYWCVVSDTEVDKTSVINQDVYTGHSFEKEVALLKALSERAERYTFIDGNRKGLDSCLTERSDGFAAMPSESQKSARDNALNEAIERFVWSTWWDNTQIEFLTSEIDCEKNHSEYLKSVISSLNIEKLILVKPKIKATDKEVQIIFGKLKGKGYISGGACGNINDHQSTFFRGLDELYRHGMAYNNATTKKVEPESFYEQRLFYFASGFGDSLVESRLSQNGVHSIELPELVIDSEVTASFANYSVHRCLFKNQPPFVGGALERLCL